MRKGAIACWREIVVLPHVACDRKTRRPSQKVNTANLHVPWRRQRFQNALWTFVPSANADIDEHHQQLTDFVKKQALAACGTQPKQPRQP